MLLDLLDLTDKNSSEWNLSDDDNDAEEMAVTKRQQGMCAQIAKG